MPAAAPRFVSAAALALGATFACLPDLAAFPDAPSASDAGAGVSCGDGLIETLDDGSDAGESCDPGDAGGAGCEACQIRCEGTLDEAGHCYFSVGVAVSYEAATSACSAKGAHVVTFASREEFERAATVGDAGFWVGLALDRNLGGYRAPVGLNEPGWPSEGDACPGCFAVSADAGSFPSYRDAGESDAECVVAENGAWFRASCNEPHPTVCEREPAGERVFACGGLLCTTLAITAGAKRYVIWQFPATAEQASRLCANDEGGSLVILESAAEREALVREIAYRVETPFNFWVGLAIDDAGVWAWDDGKARALPWGYLEPGAVGAGRAFLRVSANRFDTQLAASAGEAEATRLFVCQRPPP